MGDIIYFKNQYSNELFDDVLKNDSYLRTTALNALNKEGYEISKAGILEFQLEYDSGTKDGILGIKDFPVLICFYNDANTRQDIINYINKNKNDIEDESMKKNNKGIIIWLLAFLFFEIYGIIHCFLDIWKLFK